MTFPDRAIGAYLEASRGALHPMLSTDAAYADDVADALTPIGAEMRPFDTGMVHGPGADKDWHPFGGRTFDSMRAVRAFERERGFDGAS